MSFLNNGNPVSEFITREGGTLNSSGLVGAIRVLPPGTPALTVDKSGPATMNPAEWGDFALDVRNTGVADAFNVTLLDRLPNGPTGGMCNTTPQITERARVRGRRRDAGTGQGSSGPRDGLLARLQRRGVRAHVQRR